MRSLQWLEFDWESCRLAGRIEADLISRGESMSASDLFIAAVSLRHGQRLITRDRGFDRVPGLKVETY
ncbi:MAG: type II toxin-antitoxin system VapC family toxin [Thermoplasmata archaeon]|nr:type II toxin-antitoxin system VapC family toxin [Thermoplasmata archaeon]